VLKIAANFNPAKISKQPLHGKVAFKLLLYETGNSKINPNRQSK